MYYWRCLCKSYEFANNLPYNVIKYFTISDNNN